MRITVIDFYLPPEKCIEIVNSSRDVDCGTWKWNPFEVDIYKGERYLSGMISQLPENVRIELDEMIMSTAKELSGRDDLRIDRAYMNGWKPNEVSLPHRDQCHTTCLIYMNHDYQTVNAGETIFMEDNEDALYAVSPKCGRAVFFDGWLLHRAGSFNTTYRNDYRYTIAYKITVPEDDKKAREGFYYEK